MDRRGFLKRCSLIPFVGSLTAMAKAKEPEPMLREAGVDEIRVVWADFYDRFLYSVEGNDITDYAWASKQGWSWSLGYRDRAVAMLSGKIPSIYQELPTKVKGVQYRVYELTLYPKYLSNLYVSNLINHLYVFVNGAVIRVSILKEWINNKPLTATERIARKAERFEVDRR